MKHAYLILAHKNLNQIIQLIYSLQAENNYFFIHIDKKSVFTVNDISKSAHTLKCFKYPGNIFLYDKSINVNWGGFSQIKATLLLMNLLKDSQISPDYVHLISGQDFLLQSPNDIDVFFEKNKGTNFLDYFPLPSSYWRGNGGLHRISYKWDIDSGSKKPLGLSTVSLPENIQPYGGSQWWSLTWECVKWLTKVCVPGDFFYDFYQHTYIPDEMYFQTLLMNSHFSDSIVYDNLRYIDWKSGPEFPRILTTDDFDKLTNSGKLFARKFDFTKDKTILNQLCKKSRREFLINTF